MCNIKRAFLSGDRSCFSKNISIYAIFDESFNDTLTNDIVSFEQLGLSEPSYYLELFPHVSKVPAGDLEVSVTIFAMHHAARAQLFKASLA